MPPKLASSPLILRTGEYVYILNQDSGEYRTERGPSRVVLPANEAYHPNGVQTHTILSESQYAVIMNKDGKMGNRCVAAGPCSIVPEFGEVLLPPENKHVLSQTQALIYEEVAGDDAGQRSRVVGACVFAPSATQKVIRTMETLRLSVNEGIYVADHRTGAVKLVTGPTAFLLGPWEEFQSVEYSENVNRAVAAAQCRPRKALYEALTMQLDDDEAIQIEDYETNSTRTILGPRTVVLQPTETLTVLDLSAGKPKRTVCSCCLLLSPILLLENQKGCRAWKVTFLTVVWFLFLI